jgi:hypothetical protein
MVTTMDFNDLTKMLRALGGAFSRLPDRTQDAILSQAQGVQALLIARNVNPRTAAYRAAVGTLAALGFVPVSDCDPRVN